MDDFNKSGLKYVGWEGIKCSCCDNGMSKKRRNKHNRNMYSKLRRNKLKTQDSKDLEESIETLLDDEIVLANMLVISTEKQSKKTICESARKRYKDIHAYYEFLRSRQKLHFMFKDNERFERNKKKMAEIRSEMNRLRKIIESKEYR